MKKRKTLLFLSITAATALFPVQSRAAECSIPARGRVSVSQFAEPVSLSDCDLVGRIVTDESLALRVPPPGLRVTIDVMYIDKASDMFSISTSTDGVVTFLFVGDDTAGESVGVLSSPSACSDTAYNKNGHDENDLFEWYFNRDTTPTAQVTKDQAQTALRAGITNITQSHNDCGLADQVSATSNFKGDTNRTANIAADGSCTSRDSVNVVDFGDLPASNYGVACSWSFPLPFADDDLVEGDVSLNKIEVDWTVTPGSGCTNDYDVEGSVTHEWGHIFGLAHVNEGDHGNLTMSTQEDPCTASQRSLGRGDVLGLRDVYS